MIFLWLFTTDDTPVTTPFDLSYHKEKDDINKNNSFIDGFEVVSHPFSAPTNDDNKKSTEADDKERLLNTVVELMGLIVWEEAIDVIVTDEMYLKHVCFNIFYLAIF